MRQKSQLRTVRFSDDEAKQVNQYLKQNTLFESFSSLARVATLTMIRQQCEVHLNPVSVTTQVKRPSFIWDYDLNEVQVREILRRPNTDQKKLWLVERILREARFDEVFRYLTLSEIQNVFSKLRLDVKLKKRWEYALHRWAHNEHESKH